MGGKSELECVSDLDVRRGNHLLPNLTDTTEAVCGDMVTVPSRNQLRFYQTTILLALRSCSVMQNNRPRVAASNKQAPEFIEISSDHEDSVIEVFSSDDKAPAPHGNGALPVGRVVLLSVSYVEFYPIRTNINHIWVGPAKFGTSH
jgi:hypothetical protein